MNAEFILKRQDIIENLHRRKSAIPDTPEVIVLYKLNDWERQACRDYGLNSKKYLDHLIKIDNKKDERIDKEIVNIFS